MLDPNSWPAIIGVSTCSHSPIAWYSTSTRSTGREYVNFLNIAAGSASDARYLIALSCRLGFIPAADAAPILDRYRHLCAGPEAQIQALERTGT